MECQTGSMSSDVEHLNQLISVNPRLWLSGSYFSQPPLGCSTYSSTPPISIKGRRILFLMRRKENVSGEFFLLQPLSLWS